MQNSPESDDLLQRPSPLGDAIFTFITYDSKKRHPPRLLFPMYEAILDKMHQGDLEGACRAWNSLLESRTLWPELVTEKARRVNECFRQAGQAGELEERNEKLVLDRLPGGALYVPYHSVRTLTTSRLLLYGGVSSMSIVCAMLLLGFLVQAQDAIGSCIMGACLVFFLWFGFYVRGASDRKVEEILNRFLGAG